ncbi:hypothetical protein ACRS5S_28540 [Nocardia asiatica]|uniref:hypothetical protein n=1 Tax=Nocardia asiatica TaxID=209252 RepID=UPI003EE20FEB
MREFDQVENESRAKSASDREAGFRALLGDHYEQLFRASSTGVTRYLPSPGSISLFVTSFLDGVGQPVREDFSDALIRWHSAGDDDTTSFTTSFGPCPLY